MGILARRLFVGQEVQPTFLGLTARQAGPVT